jgi:hypothetical protein
MAQVDMRPPARMRTDPLYKASRRRASLAFWAFVLPRNMRCKRMFHYRGRFVHTPKEYGTHGTLTTSINQNRRVSLCTSPTSLVRAGKSTRSTAAEYPWNSAQNDTPI